MASNVSPQPEIAVHTKSQIADDAEAQGNPPSNHLEVSTNHGNIATRPPESNSKPESNTLTNRAHINSTGSLGGQMQEEAEVGCLAVVRAFLRHSLVGRWWQGVVAYLYGLFVDQAADNEQDDGRHPVIGNPDEPNTPFTDIIQQAKPTNLDIRQRHNGVKSKIEQAHVEYSKFEVYMLDRLKGDLYILCFNTDVRETLCVKAFKVWYNAYKAAVLQLEKGTFEAFQQHAASGYLFNPETDEPFTKDEIKAYKESLKKWRQQALSLVDGPFRFELAAAEEIPEEELGGLEEQEPTRNDKPLSVLTDGLLDDDGAPNFSNSSAWDDDQLVSKWFRKEQLQVNESLLLPELKNRGPDVLRTPNLEVTLDGKPCDLLELLPDVREGFARTVEEGVTDDNRLICKTLANLTVMLDHLVVDGQFLSTKFGELAKDEQTRLADYYQSYMANKPMARRALLGPILKSIKSLKDSGVPVEVKIRAMPLEFIYDICAAWNHAQIQLDNNLGHMDFVRIQPTNCFLPRDLFLRAALLNYSSLNYRFVGVGQGGILYPGGKYLPIDPKLHKEVPDGLQELMDACEANGAGAALFHCKAPNERDLTDPPEYQLQVVLNFSSTDAAENVASVHKIVDAVEVFKQALQKENGENTITVGISGNVNVKRSQLDEQHLELPKGFEPPEDCIEPLYSWHPQLPHRVGPAGQPLTGSTMTTYCSGSDDTAFSMSKVHMGGRTKSTKIGPSMVFRTTRNGVTFDAKQSHMSVDVLKATIEDRRDKNTIKTLDINPQRPRFRPRTENFNRHLGVNGVIKNTLGQEVVDRAVKAYNAYDANKNGEEPSPGVIDANGATHSSAPIVVN